MADIKISNLEETTSLENFYVPGVKETSGALDSKKFDLTGFQEDIEQTISSIQGEVGEFDSTHTYCVGQYVMHEGSIYRFLTTHISGDPWSSLEVTEVTVYSELQSLGKNSYEDLVITVGSSDNLLTVDGLVVTITTSDNTQHLICDSSGMCSARIPVGTEYTVSLPTKAGYYSIGDSTYTAEYLDRYLEFVYNKSLSGTCSTDLMFVPIGGGSLSDFNTKTVTIYNDDSTTFQTATINSSGVASFTGLTKGISYHTGIPTVSNYVTPANQYIIPTDNNGLNFFYKYIGSNTYGVFLVDSEFNEYEMGSLYTDATSGETGAKQVYTVSTVGQAKDTKYVKWNGTHPTKENSIAIHVYTQELAESGNDYYIKIPNLYGSLTTRAWCSSQVSLPDIPTSTSATSAVHGYNGKLMTYYMSYDSRVVLEDKTSAAAEYASQQTFNYNGTTLQGFIGTIKQMNVIFSNPYISHIYCVLGLLEYFSSPTSAAQTTYYDRSTWCSSQYSATYAWYWLGTNHYWSTNTKATTLGVLPLFAL